MIGLMKWALLALCLASSSQMSLPVQTGQAQTMDDQLHRLQMLVEQVVEVAARIPASSRPDFVTDLVDDLITFRTELKDHRTVDAVASAMTTELNLPSPTTAPPPPPQPPQEAASSAEDTMAEAMRRSLRVARARVEHAQQKVRRALRRMEGEVGQGADNSELNGLRQVLTRLQERLRDVLLDMQRAESEAAAAQVNADNAEETAENAAEIADEAGDRHQNALKAAKEAQEEAQEAEMKALELEGDAEDAEEKAREAANEAQNVADEAMDVAEEAAEIAQDAEDVLEAVQDTASQTAQPTIMHGEEEEEEEEELEEEEEMAEMEEEEEELEKMEEMEEMEEGASPTTTETPEQEQPETTETPEQEQPETTETPEERELKEAELERRLSMLLRILDREETK